jgi:type IV secretory pathway VirB10-like protein
MTPQEMLQRVARAQEQQLARRQRRAAVRTRLLVSLDARERPPQGRAALALSVVAMGFAVAAVLLARRLPSSEPVAAVPNEVTSVTPAAEAAAGPPAAPSSAGPTAVEPPPPRPPQRRPAVAPPRTPATASAPPEGASNWPTLLRRGRYEEALAAAEAEGIATLRQQSAGDLLALAEAARRAGRHNLARSLLLAIRERGGVERQAATFALGQQAFDDVHDPLTATHWFGLVLQENPGGPLTREASGRLLESLERAGDHTGARAQAQRYLEAYPGGPHASMARGILAR